MTESDDIWHVYRLRNFSRKEVYFGVARDPDARIAGDHANGKTEAIKHWRWNADDIRWRSLSRHAGQEEASRIAHALERDVPPDGWTNIQTAGV